MNIKLICVGKLKERYWKEAVVEYQKRLSRFCKLTLYEVADEPLSDEANASQIAALLKREEGKILSRIGDSDYVISLCIEGKSLDSIELSQKMNDIFLSGKSSIAFVIGGSYGLSEQVKQRSNLKLSFSTMTFPHQLMRVVLLEQIYRSFKIMRNESYHK